MLRNRAAFIFGLLLKQIPVLVLIIFPLVLFTDTRDIPFIAWAVRGRLSRYVDDGGNKNSDRKNGRQLMMGDARCMYVFPCVNCKFCIFDCLNNVSIGD